MQIQAFDTVGRCVRWPWYPGKIPVAAPTVAFPAAASAAPPPAAAAPPAAVVSLHAGDVAMAPFRAGYSSSWHHSRRVSVSFFV